MKKFIINIWNYFKESWEGKDGKASSKKLSMLAFVITMLIYCWRVETMIHLYVFWTFAVLFAVLIGIMSWTNLATLIKFTLPALGKKDPPVQEADPELVEKVIDEKT